jgi:hypothetical protein
VVSECKVMRGQASGLSAADRRCRQAGRLSFFRGEMILSGNDFVLYGLTYMRGGKNL